MHDESGSGVSEQVPVAGPSNVILKTFEIKSTHMLTYSVLIV